MASCKDCIHFVVCEEVPTKSADDCDFFKDRSRFVELPCHVGDTVYMLTEQTRKFGRKKITKKLLLSAVLIILELETQVIRLRLFAIMKMSGTMVLSLKCLVKAYS